MADITYENLNTTTLKIYAPIENTQGLGVVDISQVGYSYSEEDGFVEMNKSLKDKLEEIESVIGQVPEDITTNDIQYNEEVTLTSKLNEIESTIQQLGQYDVQESVNAANAAESSAMSYATQAQNKYTDIFYGYYINEADNDSIVARYNIESGKYITSSGQEVDISTGLVNINGVPTSVTYVPGTRVYDQKLQDIITASNAFNTAFDADAQFAIVSKQDYTNAFMNNALNNNTIYFCYDRQVAANDLLYTLSLYSYGSGTTSIVIGQNNNGIQDEESLILRGIEYDTHFTITMSPSNGYKVSSYTYGVTNVTNSTSGTVTYEGNLQDNISFIVHYEEIT